MQLSIRRVGFSRLLHSHATQIVVPVVPVSSSPLTPVHSNGFSRNLNPGIRDSGAGIAPVSVRSVYSLQLAQGDGDRAQRGAHGGQQATENAHRQRENYSHHE